MIICNYNYAEYLDRAIRSVFEQNDPNVEVIIVDDGSTDGSQNVLSHWTGRARILFQENQGQRSAYTTGFFASSGSLLLFLDADDFLLPGALTAVRSAFQPTTSKVHFRMQLVDEYGEKLGPTIPARLGHGDVGARLRSEGVLYASAPGSANAYRRSAIAGLFPLPVDPSDRHGADYFLIYGSAAIGGEVVALATVLAAYRIHATAVRDRRGLTFGNAASQMDPDTRFENRSRQLRDWLAERSENAIRLPEPLLDFSQQKVGFVHAACRGTYKSSVADAGSRLPRLLKALWMTEHYSASMKLALSGWAIAVLATPPALTRPLARKVSNPLSRRVV